MCGIGGLFRPGGEGLTGYHEAILERLMENMHLRGPDGSGLTVRGEVGLAHTRLAIIDVNERAGQPMESEDWVLSCNGEIYNYRAIKEELVGRYEFRTTSDTEVLLMALQEWGMDTALGKCAGMFAFLAYNKRERVLYAARDRLGIKPLLMALLDDGTFCFASSAGAIVKATPDIDWQVFKPALASFFVLGAPFTRTTVYDRIERVSPAHYVRCLPDGTFETVKYWEPRYRPGFTMDDMVSVVREYQVSDVKSALFLSGGVDSTFLAAAMDSLDCFHLTSPETRYAKNAAKVFGRKFVCVTPDLADYETDVERVIGLHGEPLMSCGIPNSVTRELHAKGYKMAISANGADELFHGYYRTLSPEYTPDYLPFHERRTYRFLNQQLAHLFRNSDHFRIEELQGYIPTLREIGNEILDKLSLPDFSVSANHRWLELMTYVLFDLNPTLDAASMANSVEVRVPFLDHRIVEGVLSWPAERLITTKYGRKSPMKEYLAQYFPMAFFNRPKLGFSIFSDLLGDIEVLGTKALAAGMETGFITVQGKGEDGNARDRKYLGLCCFSYEKWKQSLNYV
ncbi:MULTISPECIES: asparagine synthase (glutamine-hydrolyzing) [unclassified Pseudodesulfovibrio]|uniref:asparagine synthase (glutamine-hydrolyzing) n=1 Tax=unclassified Pseudodesulfovibrio TaxID=2661612 RepID=UPI000FEBD35A|nr:MULTISPECIES: asparagine synthase (glutamine-hydrolyzing) [unclassified Pseudodesulfovibrio]MCJ2165005.1 asparagine synthase (glutamine-hydrolyzing) [Pseudodesulfovibrio sp. S3-i]RWU03555.1 asparagine synthase (glutamine-hydrolyzing) [Pseudodesulfovibrio sp. S3]